MAELKRDQIVGARMVGASVTKTAELFGVAKSTVLKIITALENEGRNPPHWSKTLKETKAF